MSLWKIEPESVCELIFKVPNVEIATQCLIFRACGSARTSLVSLLGSATTASHLLSVQKIK